MMKSPLKYINDSGSAMLEASMKFESCFTRKGGKHFILNYLLHIAKYVRNNCTKKDNYFKYPKLTPSNEFVLEAGFLQL